MTPAQNFAINMVAVVALSMAMAYVGPSMEEGGTPAQQASAEQQQALRFAKAAQEICGPNAAWVEQEDGSIRCYLHNGKKTNTVAQVPAL
jgi:uncharacterized protein (UPF0333 family)